MKALFGTDGIRGAFGSPLIHPSFALRLGWALAHQLGEQKGDTQPTLLLGRDTRASGAPLEAALQAGALSAGAQVQLLGVLSTPALAWCTRSTQADAGVMISASHNPWQHNGFKFLDGDGAKLSKQQEQDLEQLLQRRIPSLRRSRLGAVQHKPEALQDYLALCRRSLPRDFHLKGLRLVVDCAHGACWQLAPALLAELGAEVTAIGVQPNGRNINERCGTTHPQLLQKTVKQRQADLGIAFDGDGDRVLCVDQKGALVDGDGLLYILASQHRRPVPGVVGTVMSNAGLEQALSDLNIAFVRTSVGDWHVMEQLLAKNWPLGGEPCGHIICRDIAPMGDGLLAALQLLHAICNSGRSLEALQHGFHKFHQHTVNVPFNRHRKPLDHTWLQQQKRTAEQHLGEGGRVVLRPSGTEPCIRVTVEGRDQALVESTAQELAHAVRRMVVVSG